MKRILLIAAMLLPVSSAMAGVTISADVNALVHNHDGVPHKSVTISYTSTVDVRAFALDINVDNGMNIGDGHVTDFLRGPSISPVVIPGKAKGYGIFPGRFRDFINPSVPDWDDANYMPVTPWNSPGAVNTGLGYQKVVVELGTLWATGTGDINKPALSGTLFTFDVNSENSPLGSDCNMTVAVNELRGAIVGADANPITDTNLPFTKKVTFVVLCTVPDLLNPAQTKTQAEAAIVAAGLIVGTETGIFSDTIPVNRVTAQSPAAGSSVTCGSAVNLTYVCRTIKCLSPRCIGDVSKDNWVRSSDISALTGLLTTYGGPSYRASSTTCPYDRCADINGDNWVRSSDISALTGQLSGYPSPTYRCQCGTANCPYQP